VAFYIQQFCQAAVNIIAGNAVFIRNFVQDIDKAYLMDVGIKAALGYNPGSTVEWKGDRPSTRMGAVAMLRENFNKARKTQKLIKIGKKVIDELEPLSNKLKIMVHVHKEDDVMVLLQIIKEFGIKAIANHFVDVHREEVFTALKSIFSPNNLWTYGFISLQGRIET
jgi:hypothetical protein